MLRLLLLRLLESYFRHRWLHGLPCLLMSAVAYLYIAQLPATYVAQGTLYVQDKTLLSSLTALRPDGFSWVTPAQATVSELNELLNTQAFLRAIVEQTDLEIKLSEGSETVEATIDEAREAIWLRTLGNNLVLIGATYEMPRVTHQLVAATIEIYLQWKMNLTQTDSTAAQEFFAELIKNYQQEVEPARQRLADYLATHPRPVRGERTEQEIADIARLQATLARAEERLRNAQNQEENARLARTQAESNVRQSYSVVDAPMRPLAPEPARKQILLMVALCLLAGVGLSTVGIISGALLDQTYRFPIDVWQGLQLPILAMITEVGLEVSTRPPIEQFVAAQAVPNAPLIKPSSYAGKPNNGIPISPGRSQ